MVEKISTVAKVVSKGTARQEAGDDDSGCNYDIEGSINATSDKDGPSIYIGMHI